MASGSTVAVYSAIAGNSLVMIAKLLAFLFTGSGAMFSEAIHSFADVSNQILLAIGISRSKKKLIECILMATLVNVSSGHLFQRLVFSLLVVE